MYIYIYEAYSINIYIYIYITIIQLYIYIYIHTDSSVYPKYREKNISASANWFAKTRSNRSASRFSWDIEHRAAFHMDTGVMGHLKHQMPEQNLPCRYGCVSKLMNLSMLVGWTPIYQLFWCEQKGYKVLTHSHVIVV